MDQFSRIFSKKLQNIPDTTLPVACSVMNWHETHKQLVISAYQRREAVAQKNAAVSEANLKYRDELQKKLETSLKKHDKNRKENLTKIVKTQQRKNKYVQQIASKHNQSQKIQVKERTKSFKQHQTHMEQFWSQHKIRRENSYSEQVAAPPVYKVAVERKKKLEENEIQEGLKVKLQLLNKHQSREQLVYKKIDKKQQQIHQAHEEQIHKNLEKHEEIVTTRREKFINDIGKHFAQSEEVLKKQEQQLQKKIKDKIYDDYNNRQTVRSTFIEKQRNKSATLSDCKCKRINNVEEGLTKSTHLMQKLKQLYLTDTLKVHEKNPSELVHNRSNFIARSYSVRSNVSKNQEMLKQRVDVINSDRLRREKEIADALALKKSLQLEGNCYVRVANVK